MLSKVSVCPCFFRQPGGAKMSEIDRGVQAGTSSTSLFKSLSSGISLGTAAVGGLVLAGWALDNTVLKSIVPGLASMKSNAALLFVLGGLSLWMQVRGRWPWQIARFLAVVVTLVGLLTLGEYLFDRDLGIDELLFRDTSQGALHPGRMSPATAWAFLLIGLSLVYLDDRAGGPWKELLVVLVFAISSLALIGYLYGVSSLYQIGVYSSMALHTTLSFILLSVGILFSRPEGRLMGTILADTPGGNILRRFLPTAIVLPVLLGWIRLRGQQMGLYDTAFGLALMVVSLITTLTIFIWINAIRITEIDLKRKRAHESLQESEIRFRSTLESMIEGCQIIGYDWRYRYLNDSAVKHSLKPKGALIGRTMMDCYPGIEETAVFNTLRRCMEERTSQHMVNEFIYPDGSRGWFELSIQPAPDGIFILSSDITQHKLAERALLDREMKLTTLFEIMPVGISILDAERNVSYTNPALKRIFSITEQEPLKDIYKDHKYLRSDETLMPVEELARTRAFKEKREIDDVETGVLKKDNSIVWTNVSAVPVDFPDWKVVLVTSDITRRKQAEKEIFKLNAELEAKVEQRTAELAAANEQLYHLSLFDELTGLYNRRGFLIRAIQQMQLARATNHNLLIFYADLDGLKQINDRLGHTMGDEAIVIAGRALSETFRAADIKARLGGDEFIVMAQMAEEQDAQALVARLRQQLSVHDLSMSVGVISIDLQSGEPLDSIIHRADQTMYAEKRNKPDRRKAQS